MPSQPPLDTTTKRNALLFTAGLFTTGLGVGILVAWLLFAPSTQDVRDICTADRALHSSSFNTGLLRPSLDRYARVADRFRP